MTFKRGDKHPSKNLIFWSYRDKAHLKEQWYSPEAFDKKLQYAKGYYKSERGQSYHKDYYSKNKDRVLAGIKKAQRVDVEKHALKYLLQSIRTGAARRGVPFLIDLDFVNKQWEVQEGRCYYTGIEMDKTAFKKDPFQVSIDQRICGEGYTPDNAVLCCQAINFAKNNYTEERFRQFLDILQKH